MKAQTNQSITRQKLIKKKNLIGSDHMTIETEKSGSEIIEDLDKAIEKREEVIGHVEKMFNREPVHIRKKRR